MNKLLLRNLLGLLSLFSVGVNASQVAQKVPVNTSALFEILLNKNLGQQEMLKKVMSILAKYPHNSQILNAKNDTRSTPLMVASRFGYFKIVQELIKEGAEVNIQDNHDWTALFHAIAGGHTEVARALIDAGALINIQERLGFTPLLLAAQDGHMDIVKLLISKNADMNIKENGGSSAVMLASDSGHTALVKMLLDLGADVNMRDAEGWTPLMLAIVRGFAQTAEALIQAGADVNAQNSKGYTPLLLAVQEGLNEIAKKLVISGARLTTKEYSTGTNPLLFASQKGNTALVKELLQLGSEVNVQDNEGWTPLMFVVQNSHLATAQELIKSGADLNKQNSDGETALMVAVMKNRPEMVKLLLDRGADIALENKQGKVAADFAKGRVKEIESYFLPKELELAFAANSAQDYPTSFKHASRAYALDIIKTEPEQRIKLLLLLGKLSQAMNRSKKELQMALFYLELAEKLFVRDKRTDKELQADIQMTLQQVQELLSTWQAKEVDAQIKELLALVVKKMTAQLGSTDIQEIENIFQQLSLLPIADQAALNITEKMKEEFVHRKAHLLVEEIQKANVLPDSKYKTRRIKQLIADLEKLDSADELAYAKSLLKNSPELSRLLKEHTGCNTAISASDSKKEEGTKLLAKIKESLEKKQVLTVQNLVRDYKSLALSDVEQQKEYDALEQRYEQLKKTSIQELQAAFSKALEVYSQKPSNARLQEAIRVLGEWEMLTGINEYIRAARRDLSQAKKNAQTGRVQSISPQQEHVDEIKQEQDSKEGFTTQEQYVIIDPFNLLQDVAENQQKVVVATLEQLRTDYRNASAKKLNAYEGLWRVRAGDYRIIYVLLPEQQAIGLIAVGPRASVYEDLGSYANREAYFIALNTYDLDELFSSAQEEMKTDAAKALALLELYRWIAKQQPYDVQKYLKSLVYSGGALIKLKEFAKAQELFEDLIIQTNGQHLLQQQARVGLAQTYQEQRNLTQARAVLEQALTLAQSQKERKELEERLEKLRLLSPTHDIPQQLREKLQQAQALAENSPAQAEQLLREFIKEAGEYAELTAERTDARRLLDKLAVQDTYEAILQNAFNEFEEGNYADAQEHFEAYSHAVGAQITPEKQLLIDEKLAEIALAHALQKRAASPV